MLKHNTKTFFLFFFFFFFTAKAAFFISGSNSINPSHVHALQNIITLGLYRRRVIASEVAHFQLGTSNWCRMHIKISYFQYPIPIAIQRRRNRGGGGGFGGGIYPPPPPPPPQLYRAELLFITSFNHLSILMYWN